MTMRKLKLGAGVVGLLLVLAAAGELAFGSWFTSDPMDRLDLPRDETAQVAAAGLYAGAGGVLYRRDHWGFRGGAVDPARITVLTLGGGTTEQFYLSEPQTWQQVLQQQFQAAGRDDVTVANAGRDGAGTAAHLTALRQWFPLVPGLRPSFVLAYVGLDELGGASDRTASLGDTPLWREIRRHSGVFRLARQVAERIRPRTASRGHHAVNFTALNWTEAPARPITVTEAEMDAYRQRLKAMADEIHAMGAVPVFITQTRADSRRIGGKLSGVATAAGPNGIDQYNVLAGINAATRQVCRDQGLLCLDAAREVTFEPGDFYDYVHTTPAGAQKLGLWLYGKLAGLV